MLRIEHHEYIFGHHSCTWNLLSASLSASLSANSRIATFDEERSRHAGTRSGWFRAYKQQLAAWLASVRSRYATKEDLSLLARIARGDPCPCVPGHACLFTITSTNKIVDRQRSTQSTTVDPRASTSACLESSFKSDDSRLDLSRALDSIRRAFRFKEDRDSRGGAAFLLSVRSGLLKLCRATLIWRNRCVLSRFRERGRGSESFVREREIWEIVSALLESGFWILSFEEFEDFQRRFREEIESLSTLDWENYPYYLRTISEVFRFF